MRPTSCARRWRSGAAAARRSRRTSPSPAEADGLDEPRLAAIELRNDAELALGRHDELVAELAALVAEHPYRERLREQQILALYRSGRQKDALEAYRAAREALVEELGVEPGPALQELERAVLRQDPALAAPAAAALRRPAARAGDAARRPPDRDRRGRCAASRATARLVTLTGPGRHGEDAARARRRRGARAGAARRRRVRRPRAVSRRGAARADDRATRSASRDDTPLASRSLRDRSLLLVLDNLEQLLDGVDAAIARAARRRAAAAGARDEPRAAAALRRARVPGAAARPAAATTRELRGARRERRGAALRSARPRRRSGLRARRRERSTSSPRSAGGSTACRSRSSSPRRARSCSRPSRSSSVSTSRSTAQRRRARRASAAARAARDARLELRRARRRTEQQVFARARRLRRRLHRRACEHRRRRRPVAARRAEPRAPRRRAVHAPGADPRLRGRASARGRRRGATREIAISGTFLDYAEAANARIVAGTDAESAYTRSTPSSTTCAPRSTGRSNRQRRGGGGARRRAPAVLDRARPHRRGAQALRQRGRAHSGEGRAACVGAHARRVVRVSAGRARDGEGVVGGGARALPRAGEPAEIGRCLGELGSVALGEGDIDARTGALRGNGRALRARERAAAARDRPREPRRDPTMRGELDVAAAYAERAAGIQRELGDRTGCRSRCTTTRAS